MLYLSDNLKMRMEIQELRQKKLHKSIKRNRIMDYVFAVGGILLGIGSVVYLIVKCIN